MALYPLGAITLIGSAVAFLIGFKNNASYDRMWESRRSWGAIVNASRSFAIMLRDYINPKNAPNATPQQLRDIHKTLIHRHLAWLTALRYQLREPRQWESMNLPHNREYRRKMFKVQEQDSDLKDELIKYLSQEEFEYVMSKKNRAAQIIALQSKHLSDLAHKGLLEHFMHLELEKMLAEFYTQQGVCERIKNFPYPRQFATMNLYFVRLFILLVPFGMLQEFDKLLIWLNIPFCTMTCWVFTTMEKIGESTENPFEGSANDVPITAMSRNIEIDLLEMLDERDIPSAIPPIKNILL